MCKHINPNVFSIGFKTLLFNKHLMSYEHDYVYLNIMSYKLVSGKDWIFATTKNKHF